MKRVAKRVAKNLDLSEIPWVSLLGSMYEWYDLASFVSCAPELGQAFFPLLNPPQQLLRVMTIFSIGLCLHPVGAIIFGEIGDNGYLSSRRHERLDKQEKARDRKLNRTRALLLSFVTALVPTFMMCFIPGYEQAGKASQVMLVTARVIQGMSVGGQTPGCHVLAISTCRTGNRGFRGALCHSASAVGFVLATIVVTASRRFDPNDEWNRRWSVPFYASLLFMLPMVVWLCKMSRETNGMQTEVFVEIDDLYSCAER